MIIRYTSLSSVLLERMQNSLSTAFLVISRSSTASYEKIYILVQTHQEYKIRCLFCVPLCTTALKPKFNSFDVHQINLCHGCWRIANNVLPVVLHKPVSIHIYTQHQLHTHYRSQAYSIIFSFGAK